MITISECTATIINDSYASGTDPISSFGIKVHAQNISLLNNFVRCIHTRAYGLDTGIQSTVNSVLSTSCSGSISSNTVTIDVNSARATYGIVTSGATTSGRSVSDNTIYIDNADTSGTHYGIFVYDDGNIIVGNTIDMVNSHATKDVGIRLDWNISRADNNSGTNNSVSNAGKEVFDSGVNNKINTVDGGSFT